MGWDSGGAERASGGWDAQTAADASAGTRLSGRAGEPDACGGTCGEVRVTSSSGSSPPALVAGAAAEAEPAVEGLLVPRGEPVGFDVWDGAATAAPRPTSMLHSKKSMACLPPPPPSLPTVAPGLCLLRPSSSPTGPLLPPSPLLLEGSLPLLLSSPLPSALRLWPPTPSVPVPAAGATPSPSPGCPSMADSNVTAAVDTPVACTPPSERLACIGNGTVREKGW